MLFEALQKENLSSDQDLDLDDITPAGPARCPPAPNQKSKPPENPPPIGGLSLSQLQEKANQVITYEWVSWGKVQIMSVLLMMLQIIANDKIYLDLWNNGTFRSSELGYLLFLRCRLQM